MGNNFIRIRFALDFFVTKSSANYKMYFYVLVSLACVFVTVYGRGTPLSVTGDQINNASGKGTLSKLFTDTINSKTMVMFTGSQCGLSRGAKELMDQKQPQQQYFYYDYDTQPMGVYFIHESTKAKNTSSNKLPHIWICGKYIGGLPELRTMQDNGSLATKLKSCPK